MKSKEFKIIPEEDIMCLYSCEEDGCGEYETVFPGWHQENGVPMCPSCDVEMIYQHTEVKCDKRC